MVKKTHKKNIVKDSPVLESLPSPESLPSVSPIKIDSAEDQYAKKIIASKKDDLEKKLAGLQAQAGSIHIEISAVKQGIANYEYQLTLSGLNIQDIEPEKYNS